MPRANGNARRWEIQLQSAWLGARLLGAAGILAEAAYPGKRRQTTWAVWSLYRTHLGGPVVSRRHDRDHSRELGRLRFGTDGW